MDQFEKFKNQLISSYKLTLTKEGEKICKEIDSMLGENDELLVEKANAYCSFFTNLKILGLDTKMIKRCKNYLDDMRNYRDIKNTLEHISRTRKMV